MIFFWSNSSSIDINLTYFDGISAGNESQTYFPFQRSEVLQALLNETEIEINSVDNRGMTPLHYASKDGRLEVVRIKIIFFSSWTAL